MMTGGHGGHGHGGGHQPWRPWWRGWSGNSNSWPAVYESYQVSDNTPLYFLGGAVLLGALILSRR